MHRELHICNGKFSYMCVLKPFVLKKSFLKAHSKWIMHSMQKIMHILNSADDMRREKATLFWRQDPVGLHLISVCGTAS